MAVPLQTVKRFGEPSGGWTNKLIFGDNLQVLKELLEMKTRGQLVNADGSHGIRLCYIDPPSATKRDLKGARGQVAYRDKIAGAAFGEQLANRCRVDERLTQHVDACVIASSERSERQPKRTPSTRRRTLRD
jgi:hypothetical protein